MTSRRFPWGKTFLIGFGFLGISILWPIFNQFLPLFLQAGNPEFERQLIEQGKQVPTLVGFGLTPALAMFIMTWDNLINIFVQPWVGARSDSTWNKLGRRKIWIVMGLPIAVLGFVSIPLAKSVIAVMVFILITNFGMALFRSPVIAWLGDLFHASERSKANGVINLMGGVGGLIAYFFGGMLFNNLGRSAPFIAGAIALVISMLVVLKFVVEPTPEELAAKAAEAGADAAPEPKRGVIENLKLIIGNPNKSALFVLISILFWFIAFNAVEAALSSFAVFTLGIAPGNASMYAAVVSLSFMLFSVPSGLIATKVGRRKTIRVGLTGLTLLFLVGYFVINGVATFIGAMVLVGFFWALVNVNSLPMVYDYGDERRLGAYTGLYYFFSQTAAVLGPVLSGLVVDLLGDQYRWTFLFATLFMALAWVTMSRVGEVVPHKLGAKPTPAE
ncbi:MAG TPA: MFS transporter [Anaerolineaceae bacterium]|nr:MFS transporter [Anaerolineaceae bacterium]HQH86850.1 MFS transporter [Anaerolineaceae bacterium]HQN43307.1 MFS transporter [Anaerolineaceae bacterium]